MSPDREAVGPDLPQTHLRRTPLTIRSEPWHWVHIPCRPMSGLMPLGCF